MSKFRTLAMFTSADGRYLCLDRVEDFVAHNDSGSVRSFYYIGLRSNRDCDMDSPPEECSFTLTALAYLVAQALESDFDNTEFKHFFDILKVARKEE